MSIMQKNKYFLLAVLPLFLSAFSLPEPLKLVQNNALNIEIYLELDGIDGDAQEQAYTDWIELENYSFDANNSAFNIVNSGSVGGKPTGSDLSIEIKAEDKSLTKLYEKVLNSNQISDAKLHIINRLPGSGPSALQLLEQIELKDVYVTSVRIISGDPIIGDVEVHVDIAFGKIQRSLYQYNSSGNQIGSPQIMQWDYPANTESFN